MTRLSPRGLLAAGGSVVLSAALLVAIARADSNEGIPTLTAAAEAKIAVGGLHTCAIETVGGVPGSVQCWGSNDQGQLGNNTTVTSTDPVTVPGLRDVTAITAGNTHTCALVDDGTGNGTGTVKCWGLAANGQLGDGTVGDKQLDLTKQPNRRTPVTVVKDTSGAPLTSVVAVSAGGFHTCAVVKDVSSGNQTAWCWGDDGAGQLGDGKPGDRTPIAQPVLGLGATVSSLALGEFHSCALLADGNIKCWGANSFGQLGVDPASLKSSASPVTISATDLGAASSSDPPPVAAITAGYGHVCALLKDNTVKCWGANNFGQLGYKTAYENASSADYQAIEPKKTMKPSSVPGTVRHNNHSPTLLDPGTENLVDQGGVIAISAGQFHTCALITGGSARCWGEGGRGQLGTDPYPYSSNSAQLEDSVYSVSVQGLGGAAAITAGGFHTCAVVGTGMRCWGYNFYGQLGSSAPGSLVPVQVTAVTGATKVAAGTGFACALIDADVKSRPVCWGDNSSGQLGTSQPGVAKTTIRTPVDAFSSAAALDAGNGHACATPAGSQAPLCWGLNDKGQVGDGTTVSPRLPVAVSGLTTATAVSAGGGTDASPERGHTCAVRADTTAVCWGRDTRGQLGNHAQDDFDATPVVVQYLADPGTGTFADLTGLSAVATGGFHSCAIAAADGSVWCWGYNASGQLGDGTTSSTTAGVRSYAAHVQVNPDPDPDADNPLTGVVALAAGTFDTCALLADGSVRCWGDNGRGQIGDGTTAERHLPTQVSGLDASPTPLGTGPTTATAITAGDDHTCAVVGDGSLRCWGGNASGELGDGSTSDRPLPTQVTNLGPPPAGVTGYIKSVSASRDNTCAVLIDTTVYCWGDNTHDQLGDGIGATSVSLRTVALAGTI